MAGGGGRLESDVLAERAPLERSQSIVFCRRVPRPVLSRNPAFAIAAPVVIGMVMQLTGSLGGVEALRPFLLTTPFEAWHGLLAETRFYGPLAWGTFSSAIWCAVCLTWAFVALRRRDVTGG